MLLETARRYNHETESITFLKDFTYSKDDFPRAGLQVEFINPIFEFSRAMRRLQLDDAEFALLIAIDMFSADRPNVQQHGQVEALQQPYVEALHAYTLIKRPQVPAGGALSAPSPPPGRGRGEWLGDTPPRPPPTLIPPPQDRLMFPRMLGAVGEREGEGQGLAPPSPPTDPVAPKD
ncbi:Oxysterols receptor LXR-beta [Platysternon megacephalum]|uniref:Oxysterols receptor LXR-beta n=1 Tax=Platysternon megacephalum TaxID=55544 RepID=A0A4D9DC26_9SAUR|nr:Oxysterols receptor LXR-beta [Platysternon megacephalum]